MPAEASNLIDLAAAGPALEREGGAADYAYAQIRRAILQGELSSGEKLLEKQLAERFGVSRTPVREALSRLSAHGLVVLEHYRRGYVAQFTVEDAREILRLRSILESHAARRAATRITDAQIERLAELASEMERRLEQHGYEAYLPHFDLLNAEFHAIIAAAADSPRLLRLLETSLELPAVRLNEYREPGESRARRTNRQHRELIDAFRARHPEWAAHEMATHLICLIPPDTP